SEGGAAFGIVGANDPIEGATVAARTGCCLPPSSRMVATAAIATNPRLTGTSAPAAFIKRVLTASPGAQLHRIHFEDDLVDLACEPGFRANADAFGDRRLIVDADIGSLV